MVDIMFYFVRNSRISQPKFLVITQSVVDEGKIDLRADDRIFFQPETFYACMILE